MWVLSVEEVTDRVRRYGWDHYRTWGGPLPDWSYSIGLDDRDDGAELVLAGGASFTERQVNALFRELSERSQQQRRRPAAGEEWRTETVGTVRLGSVHETWAKHLLRVADDYYGSRAYRRLQVIPPKAARTMDVPDLSLPFDPVREPPWRWLVEDWPYRVPADTLVFTDLQALHGACVVEVHHDRDDGVPTPWHLFASASQVIADELGRIAPLGVLISTDSTLAVVDDVPPGELVTRHRCEEPWQRWTARSTGA
jgi:hypothetical protein